MKHQNLIDTFVAKRDENDGYSDIIWLPACEGMAFNNVLPEPCTDILAAYMGENRQLQFLCSSWDDDIQEFRDFGKIPYSIQKLIYEYIF
jgi:hypothetical protein